MGSRAFADAYFGSVLQLAAKNMEKCIENDQKKRVEGGGVRRNKIGSMVNFWIPLVGTDVENSLAKWTRASKT